MISPWLNIPASDYEGHMGSPEVNQTGLLSGLFKNALEQHDCTDVALLGCATGNGLEHIEDGLTKRITAVDINGEYLGILRQRYSNSISGLEVIQCDLEACELEDDAYSIVFAALVFEYINPAHLLEKIWRWLKKKGHLVTVLQLPSDKANITETPYSSLKALSSIMNLVEPDDYNTYALEAGLSVINRESLTLQTGKSFAICTHMKEG